MRLSFVRYADLAHLVNRHAFPPEIKCVIGVPRSGMFPAAMIATRLGVVLGMVGSTVARGGFRVKAEDLKPNDPILLVDDSVRTGASMEEAKHDLVRSGIPESSIRTMAILADPDAVDKVDCHIAEVPTPRIFEWNLWHNDLTAHVMFDMDGVFCFDPPVFDDDGPAYENAIRNAVPRFLPSRPIHSIVTNRIERWRGVTEKWLERHGVEYGSLVMQPFDTAEERRSTSDPAAYKALHYGDSAAWLFVESHDHLGSRIAEVSGKPVFSVETSSIFQGRKS